MYYLYPNVACTLHLIFEKSKRNIQYLHDLNLFKVVGEQYDVQEKVCSKIKISKIVESFKKKKLY